MRLFGFKVENFNSELCVWGVKILLFCKKGVRSSVDPGHSKMNCIYTIDSIMPYHLYDINMFSSPRISKISLTNVDAVRIYLKQQ